MAGSSRSSSSSWSLQRRLVPLLVAIAVLAALLPAAPVAAVQRAGAVAWGDGDHGKLGTGADESAPVTEPVDASMLDNALEIAPGSHFTAWLHPSRTVQAIGLNNYGQLGDGTTTSRALEPDQVKIGPASDLGGVSDVAAGSAFGIAIRDGGTPEASDNEIWHWGSVLQMNDGSDTYEYATALQDGAGSSFKGATAIAAGSHHALALKNDTAWAWGSGGSGALGNGSSGSFAASPVPVSTLTGVTEIAAGYQFSVAIANGKVWAWGLNDQGQLGNGAAATDAQTTPVPVVDGDGVQLEAVAVSAGQAFGVALRADGSVYTWGSNSVGQLGTTGGGIRRHAALVPGLPVVTALDAGANHTIARTVDATVFAWGGNGSGQLGNGTTTSSATPVRVAGITAAHEVGAGFASSIATMLARVSSNRAAIDFGEREAATASSIEVITFTNEGPGSVDLYGFDFEAPGFVLRNSTCAAPQLEGGTCSVEVSFAPAEAQSYDATLTLLTGGANNPSVTLSGVGTPSTVAPRKIAFVRRTATGMGVAVMDEDGTDIDLLTDGNVVSDQGPAWSPDGKKLAFGRRGAGVFMMDADGTDLDQLTFGPDDGQPTWSPDGAKIAYQQRIPGDSNFRIAVVDTATEATTVLTSGPFDIAPDWHPQGDRVGFSRDGQIWEIGTADVEGETLRQLTTIGGVWSDFSPDGSQLAFTNQVGGQQIYVQADGGAPRRVETATSDAQPSFSPDGTRLAVESFSGGSFGIATVRTSGSGFARLTTNANGDYEPAWQPAAPAGDLTLSVDRRAVPASPSSVAVKDLVLTDNAPGPEGLPPLLDQNLSGLPPLLDQNLTGLPLLDQNLSGLPLLDQNLSGLPPLLDQNLSGLPLLDQNLSGLPPLLDQNLSGLPLLDQNLSGLPPLFDQNISGLPVPEPGGWHGLLVGSPFAGLPIEGITLRDLLGLLPRPGEQPTTDLQRRVAALKLHHIDWSQSAGAVIGAVPLALTRTTFRQIEAPPDGPSWCARFETMGFLDCGAGFGGLDATVLAFQLAGGDLTLLPVNRVLIGKIDLRNAALLDIKLARVQEVIGLGRTPLGSILVSELPRAASVVDCTRLVDCATATLAHAGARGAIVKTASFRDLGTTASNGAFQPIARLAGFALGEVVFTLLLRPPVEDLSPERLQLDHYGGDSSQKLTYTLEYTFAGATAQPTASVTLPDSFRYVPGSSSLVVRGGSSPGSSLLPEPSISAGKLTWVLAGRTFDPSTTMRIFFDARPGLRTGEFSASASLHADQLDEAAFGQAFVAVGQNFENNDDPEGAPVVGRDTLYLTHVSGKDIDYFQLPVPTKTVGTEVRAVAGARFQIRVTNVASDTDLVAYLPAGLDHAQPPRTAPPKITLRGAPLFEPTVGSPLVEEQSTAAGASSATQQTANDVPLRGDLTVAGLSASHGIYDEFVEIEVPAEAKPGDYFTLQLSRYNAEIDDDPVLFQITELQPPALPPCAAPRSFPKASEAFSLTAKIPDPATLIRPSGAAEPTETLVLVSAERLRKLYGAASTENLLDRLAGFVDHAAVRGQIVSLDATPAVGSARAGAAFGRLTSAFAEHDASPCDIAGANEVVAAINAVVDALLQDGEDYNLRSLVLLGTDDVIPHGRVADLTRKFNERLYRGDMAFTFVDGNGSAKSNPLTTALASGYVVSDAGYGDFAPYEFPTGFVSVPQLAVGRLVETPQDMTAALERFVQFGGTLDGASAMAAGYDFVSDNAEAVDAAFRTNGADDPLLLRGDAWTAADLVNGFSTTENGASAPRDLVSVNGHHNHYLVQPAAGTELVTAAASGGQAFSLESSVPTLARTGVFTLSCHTALNVPDIVLSNPTVPQQTRLRDWPQAYGAKGASFLVGASGYGYGEKYTLGYGERVVTAFAEGLDAGALVADAFVSAQQQYFQGLGVPGVYDAKVLQETMFFGLPMYRMSGGTSSVASASAATASTLTADGPAAGTSSRTETISAALTERVQADGTSHFVVGGDDPVLVHDMPITAAKETPITTEGKVAVGALATSIEYEDVADFVPSISRPVVDHADREPAVQSEDLVFPLALQRVGTAYGADGLEQSLVTMHTQFRATGLTPDGRSIGTLRKMSSIESEIFFVDAEDAGDRAPTFTRVEGSVEAVGGNRVLDVTVEITEDVIATSPVAKVLVLVLENGGSRQLWLTRDPNNPLKWTGSRAVTTANVEFIVQAVRESGVVGVSFNKRLSHGNSTAPRIVISSPKEDGVYLIGHPLVASYVCLDGDTGKSIPTCVGDTVTGEQLATSAPGRHTFEVTATGTNGKTITKSIEYSVRYAFEGFFAPVQNDPYRNQAKAGQAVPLKWKLRDDAGALYAGLKTEDVDIWFERIKCTPAEADFPLPQLLLVPTPLTWDPVNQRYQAIVKTPKDALAGTCQRLTVEFFGDPSAPATADFQFK